MIDTSNLFFWEANTYSLHFEIDTDLLQLPNLHLESYFEDLSSSATIRSQRQLRSSDCIKNTLMYALQIMNLSFLDAVSYIILMWWTLLLTCCPECLCSFLWFCVPPLVPHVLQITKILPKTTTGQMLCNVLWIFGPRHYVSHSCDSGSMNYYLQCLGWWETGFGGCWQCCADAFIFIFSFLNETSSFPVISCTSVSSADKPWQFFLNSISRRKKQKHR